MRYARALLQIAFPFLAMWLAASAALAAPVIGTVLKGSGSEPLVKAQVEWLRPGTEEVVYRALTDVKGKFALRDVAPGVYEVRVRFGRVLEQVTGPKPVRRRIFAVREKAIRLPPLRVR